MKPQIFSWLKIPKAPAGVFVTLTTFVLVASLYALPLLIMPAQPARAREALNDDIIVNSSLDTHDWLPGDGICADSGFNCTLRAAIEEANDLPGADKIIFDSKMDIQLDTTIGALPDITEKLRIDASSVWDSGGNKPGVTVNGGSQTFTGLRLLAGNCEVYGLLLKNFSYAVGIYNSANNTIGGPLHGQRNVINNNKSFGVSIHGTASHHNVVSGNWIGLSVSGDTKAPNDVGIQISGGAYQNTIGGDAPGKGNYISGNKQNGVEIIGAGSDGNRLGANLIGLPALGSADNLGNDRAGVYINNGPTNTYIGSSASDLYDNEISFNGTDGVLIWDSSGNWVESNLFFANKLNGVAIVDGADNSISSNTILFSIANGVRVSGSAAVGNTILANSIYFNLGQGIDLFQGGNTELPAPVILTVNATEASGTGCAGCIVHLYSDPEDEGAYYEGFAYVDGGGSWSYAGVLMGPNVTATNTDASGNTSEFSAPRKFLPLFLPVVVRN